MPRRDIGENPAPYTPTFYGSDRHTRLDVCLNGGQERENPEGRVDQPTFSNDPSSTPEEEEAIE